MLCHFCLDYLKRVVFYFISFLICRGTVISEHPDIWFKDEGGLTYKVCEDGE